LFTTEDLPAFRQPTNLSPNGTLFFESQDALSPRDTNGQIQDVYEWKPVGLDGCDRAEGCVSLISTGHSSNDSMFVDSDPSGDDAFFITREQLLPQDQNSQLDLYDARVQGGFVGSQTTPCEGAACRGALVAPPAQSAPGSAEFAGPGNPAKKHKAAKKHKHKKKRQGKHKKRPAKQSRGGSR
jgi:hypothetical protein